MYVISFGRLRPAAVDARPVDAELQIGRRRRNGILGESDVGDVGRRAGAESHSANPNGVVEARIQIG